VLHREVAGYLATIILEFRFGAGIAVEYGAFFFINILRYEDAGVEP
jgi:hypothetical protein